MRQGKQVWTMLRESPLCRYVAIVTLVAVLAVGIVIRAQVDYEHQAELSATMRINQSLAVAFEYHIHNQLDSIEDQLLFIKMEYEKNGGVTPAIQARVQGTRLFVVDEIGVLKVSRLEGAPPMDLSNREYFQAHQAGYAGVFYISKPVPSPVDGATIFHVSRRIDRPDGSFGGVVGCGVEPQYFADFYRELGLRSDYVVSIIGIDGVSRLRQSSDTMVAGVDLSGSSSFVQMQAGASGAFIDRSAVDGAVHIYNYRRMTDYPLFVQVAEREAGALKDFRQRKSRYYSMGVAVVGLLLMISAYLTHLIWQRQQAENRLGQVKATLEHDVEERTTELQALNNSLAIVNEELQRLTLSDGLTGIANRRHFNEHLEREWANAARHGYPVGLIMADIDYFKRYNDTYGHQRGDDCLKTVAAVLGKAVVRPADLAVRYGGEEFALVLPATDLAGALHVAEKLRCQVDELGLEHRAAPLGHVSISVGVTALAPAAGQTGEGLIKLADEALYQAKQGGRNRVAVRMNEA